MKTLQSRTRTRLHLLAVSHVLGFALLGAILAGCSEGKPNKVVLLGSNTVGEELAPRLIKEFKKQHPAVVFETEFKGTTYGLGALMVGRCDIAAASREASTNELELAKARNIDFNGRVIGAYDVAVIVNAACPVSTLTKDQVRDLFIGTVTNWKDVGGPDAPVKLCIRHPISGTYLGFRELAMENKPYALHVTTYTNYADLVQAVAQDPAAVGYTTISMAAKPGIKAVAIGGIAPTVDTVKQGQYPYARVLRLYTDKTSESPATTEFIQFVQSPQGQAIVSEMGFAPRL
jgi:phosphate transport system substrate-binding protein